MNSSPISYADLISIATSLGTALFAACGLAWFIFVQFSNIRRLMHDLNDGTKKILLEKIEYHERHDDQRFAAISNDLWTLKLHNAARYGLRPEIRVDDEEKPAKS